MERSKSYIPTKHSFRTKMKPKTEIFLCPQAYLWRSAGIHSINSSSSPTTQLSSLDSQSASFTISYNVHILIVPLDPVGKYLPSGMKQTELTRWMWPLNGGKRDWPVTASQTSAALSQDPEGIRLPSSEKYTEVISLSCPVIGPQTISPLLASQTRIVVSKDPETMRDP